MDLMEPAGKLPSLFALFLAIRSHTAVVASLRQATTPGAKRMEITPASSASTGTGCRRRRAQAITRPLKTAKVNQKSFRRHWRKDADPAPDHPLTVATPRRNVTPRLCAARKQGTEITRLPTTPQHPRFREKQSPCMHSMHAALRRGSRYSVGGDGATDTNTRKGIAMEKANISS